jgi:hypothetical protein
MMSNHISLGWYDYSAGNTSPATNIDTTKLADDDPSMASMNNNLSIPSWSDWPRKLSRRLMEDLTARQYRPDSRDIISVRAFNRENDQVDPMVYLTHHGNCVDEPHTPAPGIWIKQKARGRIRPKLIKINCGRVSEENTIHTTQWGVTGSQQDWRRLSVTRPMVIYDDVTSPAKEFWILAKRLYDWNCV